MPQGRGLIPGPGMLTKFLALTPPRSINYYPAPFPGHIAISGDPGVYEDFFRKTP